MKKIKLVFMLSALFVLICAASVHSQISKITKEQAMDALLSAQDDMTEMEIAGFNVNLVNDTFMEAQKAFTGENYSKILADAEMINDTKKREEAKKLVLAAKTFVGGKTTDYELVLQKVDEIAALKQRAFEVNDYIIALEMRIEELKNAVDVTEASQLLEQAKKSFDEGSYDDAEALANQGFDAADKKAAEATQLKLMYNAGKENVINFFKDNWKIIIIVSAILIVSGLIAYKIISVMLLKIRVRDLTLERDVLNDLMKKAQADRFQAGDITKKEYEIKVQRFKERLIEVEKELPVVMEKLKVRK